MTYREAEYKITEAYMHNRLNPYKPDECFIGNLLDSCAWSTSREGNVVKGHGYPRNTLPGLELSAPVKDSISFIKTKGYTVKQIVDMENNFLEIIWDMCDGDRSYLVDADGHKIEDHPNYEDAHFEAMRSTLEMLKAIHIKKGEDVDEIRLTKRVLHEQKAVI